MHRLLQRQLKKIGVTESTQLTQVQVKNFITMVDQAYIDFDEDRALLENTLSTSSQEMQGLYKLLQERSETQLAKSEEKYRRLIENLQTHYFFYTMDRNGLLTYISDSITDMLGYSKEEFATHYSTYLTDDNMNNAIHEYVQKAFEGIKQSPLIISIYHNNGSIRYLDITILPFTDMNGKINTVEGIARDITPQYEERKKIVQLAKYDALTGISNRLDFDEKFHSLLSHSKRHNEQFALLYLDIDHFKEVNDTLGHDIGDKLLRELVKRISQTIRNEDIFARVGGDEFIIVLTSIKTEDLPIIIHKMMNMINTPCHIENYTINISASIGVSFYPQDGKTAIELIKYADIAMYHSKQNGRNLLTFYENTLNDK